MTFRLTLRSEGDHSQEWTEVSAAVPRLPIMVDLKVVGRDFDEAFQIEAAPADVVERFLDPELRHALYALHPCTLQVDDGRIVWERVGWMEHGIMVEQALDLMAHAMARYRSAFSEADAQVLANAPAAGAPFRGIPDQAVVAAARSAREAEVAALAEQRSRRKPDFRPELLYGLLAGVVILAFVTLVVLL
jgi:hypothetical protein